MGESPNVAGFTKEWGAGSFRDLVPLIEALEASGQDYVLSKERSRKERGGHLYLLAFDEDDLLEI
jgi:hypothetical protein